MAQSGSGSYDPKMDIGISGSTGGQKPGGLGKGCLGCLGVIAVVVVAFGVFAATRDTSGDEARDRTVLARLACENAVRDSLKAPSTAEFDGTRATGSGSSWTVSGAVDAENSFGAMLRNTFECSVTFQGDSAYATVTRLG